MTTDGLLAKRWQSSPGPNSALVRKIIRDSNIVESTYLRSK
jgi:hypothetical protein